MNHFFYLAAPNICCLSPGVCRSVCGRSCFVHRAHHRRFKLRSLGRRSNATAHTEHLGTSACRLEEHALQRPNNRWWKNRTSERTTVKKIGPLKMNKILRAVPACVSSAVLRSRRKTAHWKNFSWNLGRLYRNTCGVSLALADKYSCTIAT